MSTPCVSVIMPAYNSKEYIDRAICSILNQDMQEWELIVIDDGSIDGTSDIIDSYARKDNRIHAYHQPNIGVSATRQRGVNLANGKYSIHCDSDDWVEPNYLSSLYNLAEATNSDLVWCDFFNGKSIRWEMNFIEDSQSLVKGLLWHKVHGSLCNKMIKTEITQTNFSKFPEDCKWGEDLAFLISVLLQCHKVAYCNKPLYHVFTDNVSLTRIGNGINRFDFPKAIRTIEQSMRAFSVYENYESDLDQLKISSVRDYVDDLRYIDYDKFISIFPEAIDRIWRYSMVPNRLKWSAFFIKHHMKWACWWVRKIDGSLQKMGLSHHYFVE